MHTVAAIFQPILRRGSVPRIRRRALAVGCGLILAVILATVRMAFAGPPYIADDPEPTDYQHFEIYSFGLGTTTSSGTLGQGGIDFNYGAAPNLQLTAVLPAGFNVPPSGGTTWGLSNVQLAAKYRFLQQDSFGWDVSVFPRVFFPDHSVALGSTEPSILLPIWVQKDWTKQWSTFGGGGCTISTQRTQDFCLFGAVATYQLTSRLQLGLEFYYQTPDGIGTPAQSSLGIGLRYDVNDNYHLLGYVRRGLENVSDTDQISWYAAVLFTF
jgi:hypothetical protein